LGSVIVADNVGIKFRRGRRRRLRMRELLHGRSPLIHPREFWALRNVSFSVEAGEALGLVGGNGQGKSTLLRLVAGVMLPDEGSIEVNGGVAPLIELQAGFSGELTVRENIYLAAGLHGLSREETDERFDEMVRFAEMEDFVDAPVRHLSSGMKARLGFAVVTRLDEPIVLVDEVLAVGDTRFRRKCNRRMKEMLGGGKTLILVSHNERDLTRFCDRGLYLRKGEVVGHGPIGDVLAQYRDDQERD
jgi:ABC-2 type transport system ATP-binding protein